MINQDMQNKPVEWRGSFGPNNSKGSSTERSTKHNFNNQKSNEKLTSFEHAKSHLASRN